jgi:hypothetical protein
MKIGVILSTAILSAISGFSQNGSVKPKPSGFIKMTEKIASRFSIEPEVTNTNFKQALGPEQNFNAIAEQSQASMTPSAIGWKLLSGSMSIYGMLVSQSKPLQYNDNINAVSFIHRKSATYNVIPSGGNNSGAIVAEISSNWGATWDSTCIWANTSNFARYPQGGIYSAPGNTNIANAYVVGCGPVTSSSAFIGDFYASKKLAAAGSTVYNSTPDAATNAQQFLSFGLTSYSATQMPHGWSRFGFSSTDDGFVRSLALIENDNSGASTMRGVSVVKGSFNAGVFNWTTDSIIPSVLLRGNGSKNIGYAPQMAWNESGTVGYVMVLGAASTALNSNKGFHPIVYKTTNSGLTWALISGIDFNSVSMTPIINSLAGVSTNSNLSIPFFNDYDMTVDANNKLHIAATLKSTHSNHNDSLDFTSQFTVSVNPGSEYSWLHYPGYRPFLYDFIGDGSSGWMSKTIDSLGSESAGIISTGAGYNENPWDPSGPSGSKGDNVDSRIHLGRTPDGQYITFLWTESDSNATNGALKYNNKPNIKARCMAIGSGTTMYQLSTAEINVSKVAVGQGTNNANVANRATLSYMSPTTSSASISGSTLAPTYTMDIYTPITVTNSNPYSQLINNTTWYQYGKLSYPFSNSTSTITTQFAENSQNSASNSLVYPNPASNNAVLAIDLKDNSSVEVSVLNTIGQLVKANKVQGQVGQNNINIDLTGLSTGIYMVNVKVGSSTSTKKLVVQ